MGELDARLASLAARFAAEAGRMAGVIETGLARHAWDDLIEPCHSLAGRAGMFGYPVIGDAARALEEAIEAKVAPTEKERLAAELLDCLQPLRQER